MKKNYYFLFLTLLSMMGFVSCGSDDEDKTPNIYEMIAGHSFKISNSEVYFYKNGMFMLEVSSRVEPGQLTYNENRAIGSWSVRGNTLITEIKATDMEMNYVHIVLPSPLTIEKDENGYWYAKKNGDNLLMEVFVGSDLHDNSDTSTADNAILGKWTGSMYITSSNESKAIIVNLDFQKDNKVRTTEDNVLKLDNTCGFKTSLGLLSFEKFLGDEPDTFYYMVEKNKLYFYDSKTANMSFQWKR